MLKGFFNVPTPINEPILGYAPGSKERELLKAAIADARSKKIDIPMYIDGKEVHTENKGKRLLHTTISMFLLSTVKGIKTM